MAGRKVSAKSTNRGGRPTKAVEDKLGVQLSVRADPETERRLIALVAQLNHFIPKTAVARAALRIGLAEVERNPSAVFDEQPLTEDQADTLLTMCWHDVRGGAELKDGLYSVWLLSGTAVRVQDDSEQTESKVSFKDALDRLARKVPPEHPLPWHRPAPKPKGSKR